MQGIIDFHTHAFPDDIAYRAIPKLEEEGGIRAFLDGSVSSLLSSMDRYCIGKSVVCSIATKPAQFEPILRWCKQIRSERIIPFPSLHPDDPDFSERITRIKGEGFKGIKFHPYYQDFCLDDERLFPLYEAICDKDLIAVVHTGFDIAFPRIPRADPAMILKVMREFPEMKLVTTHLGSWEQWEEVERLLVGKPVYMEISCSLESIDVEQARTMILNHSPEYVLFGTDSPWTDQGETLALLQGLGLDEHLERLILHDNADRLLSMV